MPYSKEFEEAFAFTIGEEAGYVNDANDPGGETKWGISKRSYPNEDIKNLTKERAQELAYKDYWLKASCDKYERPLGMVVFDNAYHSGVAAAVANVQQYPDWKDLIIERIEDMVEIVDSRPTSIKYLKGWIKRALKLYRLALSNQPVTHPISDNYGK